VGWLCRRRATSLAEALVGGTPPPGKLTARRSIDGPAQCAGLSHARTSSPQYNCGACAGQAQCAGLSHARTFSAQYNCGAGAGILRKN